MRCGFRFVNFLFVLIFCTELVFGMLKEQKALVLVPAPSKRVPSDVRKEEPTVIREEDPYKILGVGPGVSKSELTRKYRTLALKYHPDKFKLEERAKATEIFQKIQIAYETVKRVEEISKEEDPYKILGLDADVRDIDEVSKAYIKIWSEIKVQGKYLEKNLKVLVMRKIIKSYKEILTKLPSPPPYPDKPPPYAPPPYDPPPPYREEPPPYPGKKEKVFARGRFSAFVSEAKRSIFEELEKIDGIKESINNLQKRANDLTTELGRSVGTARTEIQEKLRSIRSELSRLFEDNISLHLRFVDDHKNTVDKINEIKLQIEEEKAKTEHLKGESKTLKGLRKKLRVLEGEEKGLKKRAGEFIEVIGQHGKKLVERIEELKKAGAYWKRVKKEE